LNFCLIKNICKSRTLEFFGQNSKNAVFTVFNKVAQPVFPFKFSRYSLNSLVKVSKMELALIRLWLGLCLVKFSTFKQEF
jgi:hypothetical protein